MQLLLNPIGTYRILTCLLAGTASKTLKSLKSVNSRLGRDGLD